MIERERERGRDTGRGRSRLHAGSLTGLDPGTAGSRPGPKVGAKPLRHPGIPIIFCRNLFCIKTVSNYYSDEIHFKYVTICGNF